MNKIIVLKSQRNDIYETIKELSLNPSEFIWEECESIFTRATIVSKLVHRPSQFFYLFDTKGGLYWSRFSPGREKFEEEHTVDVWQRQFNYFKMWLTYLKREVESPDLWSAISQESELLDSTINEDDNTSFTSEEKSQIISGIKEIKQYLIDVQKINPELVESRLKYLEESSERLGRKDWINILYSVIIGIILNATVTPESAREVMRFVGTVFQQFLHHTPLLL